MRRNGRDAPKAAAPVSLGPGVIKRPLLFGEPIDQPVEE